jgi:hypothetical protein
MAWILRVWSLVLGAGLLYSTVPALVGPAKPNLPDRMRLPGVALELMLDAGEVRALLARPAPPPTAEPRPTASTRPNSGNPLWLDDFVVIPLYVGFFVLFGFWLRRLGLPSARALGLTLVVVALAAGIADWTENVGIRQVLTEYRASEGQAIAEGSIAFMRRASVAKWALIAAAMALTAAPFFRVRGGRIPGLAYLVGVLLFAVGLLGLWSGLRFLVEWAFAAMGVAWLATAVGLGVLSRDGSSARALTASDAKA